MTIQYQNAQRSTVQPGQMQYIQPKTQQQRPQITMQQGMQQQTWKQPTQQQMQRPMMTMANQLQPQTNQQQAIAQQQNMNKQQAVAQQTAQSQPGNTMVTPQLSGQPISDPSSNPFATAADNAAYLAQRNAYMAQQNKDSAQIDQQRRNSPAGLAQAAWHQQQAAATPNAIGKDIDPQVWMQQNPDQAAKFNQQSQDWYTANKANLINDPGGGIASQQVQQYLGGK